MTTQGPHPAWGIARTEPQWRLTRRRGLTILLVLVLAIAIGVVAIPKIVYPLSEVADRIRAAESPRVVPSGVIYSGPNPFEGAPDRIRILLHDDTTEAEGNEFWCTVVVPAGGGAFQPGYRIRVERNHQRAGESSNLAPDPRCTDSAPIR
jgi:hypothetical protein